MSFRGAGAITIVMALVVVAGSWFGYRQLVRPDCTGSVRLTVAAAPEIAPAVRQTARQWTDKGADLAGTCITVDVAAVSPAAMTAAIASRHGVSLTGVGQASGVVSIPDVWIPDSSTWLLRLKQEASGFAPTDGHSIARSPVVVAMPEPVAQTIGWPDNKLGWSDLLKQINDGTSLRTGIVDPSRDAAGLSGLLALSAAAGTGPEGRTAAAGALRALAAGSSALRDDLVEKFPRSLDAAAIAGSLSAAPLSEEDVVAYNAERPPVSLAALYLDPAPPPLDYPYTVMPDVDALHGAVADGLAKILGGASFTNQLARVGLRAADGSVGAGFAAPVGAPVSTTPSAAPTPSGSTGGAAVGGVDAGAISQALGSWAAVTLPGRVLAVFDISGSMAERVPTAGNLTRAEVTRRAAQQGLALFDDRWAVGVWLFSTKLRGSRDWREIVRISPLSAKRSELQESVAQIVPKKNGGTGLYDTALAAYRTVLDSWQAGRVNSVLLFTDGQNEDPDGLSQAKLIAELNKTADPKRPIRMIIVGIGTSVDRNELLAITTATGGGVFIAEDPAKIGDIFLAAISSRTGAAT